MNNVLELIDVKRKFVQGDVTIEVLRGVDLRIGKGELVALLGPSGSGKSTMLQAIGLLEGGFSGSIKLDGEEVSAAGVDRQTEIRRQKLGFVYQFHHLLPEFSAVDNVAMPLWVRRMSIDAAREVAADMLAQVGLSARMQHRPAELSGGERQRVAVARALVSQPACVLADEPTGNLDRVSANLVFELMLSLAARQQTALVMVTHDASLAASCQRQYRLDGGILKPLNP
jgi:lipoprotein-releasing system ATP-binding protein